jgi:hypothetical protein
MHNNRKVYSMNTKFSTVIHTLTFASLGASVVATKFFSDYSNSLAMPLTVATVALGIASVVTLIGELRKAEEESTSRDLDSRFDEIWLSIRDHRREVDAALVEDRRNCHLRMDQEVEALHSRISEVQRDCNRDAAHYSSCKKKVSL